jgi:hypothetical protein
MWTSSDPGAATVTTPGNFSTVGSGFTELNAQDGAVLSRSSKRFVYTVAPGLAPERMVQTSVVVAEGMGRALSGVKVDITPDRGPGQSCVTTIAQSACHFWLLQTSFQVVGTKEGYYPAQTTQMAPVQAACEAPGYCESDVRLQMVRAQ